MASDGTDPRAREVFRVPAFEWKPEDTNLTRGEYIEGPYIVTWHRDPIGELSWLKFLKNDPNKPATTEDRLLQLDRENNFVRMSLAFDRMKM